MGTTRDPAAFCEELSPRLVGSLLLFCGERHAAEDLAQDALARALERWDEVASMDAPEAWGYRVAFNLARSAFRRRAAGRRGLRRLGAATSVDQPDSAMAITVRQLVAALPPRQRAAIIARYYAGLDVEETAVALACAPGTVRALTHQGIERLRRSGLAHVDDDDGPAAQEVHENANAG